jgi:hypothetical protein
MPLYPFECPHCHEEFDIPILMDDYVAEDSWQCIKCDGDVSKDNRVMVAANVTRASFVDGTKRPGFAELKEANKLKTASYNMKPEDRGDIRKTISEIEKSGK